MQCQWLCKSRFVYAVLDSNTNPSCVHVPFSCWRQSTVTVWKQEYGRNMVYLLLEGNKHVTENIPKVKVNQYMFTILSKADCWNEAVQLTLELS
jgi:hypothetical protein